MEMWQLKLEIVRRLNPKQRMDSTSTNLTRIIAVNEPIQIWQMCCDPEAASYYENVLAVVFLSHWLRTRTRLSCSPGRLDA